VDGFDEEKKVIRAVEFDPERKNPPTEEEKRLVKV